MVGAWSSVTCAFARALAPYSRIDPTHRWGTPTWEIPTWVFSVWPVSRTLSMAKWASRFMALSKDQQEALHAAYGLGGVEAVRSLAHDYRL